MKDENNSSKMGIVNVPSLPSLLAFESAARTLSFARAAEELGRTPSAISHAIKNLEARLGASLFLRSGRSIQLSGAGEDFLGPVQHALQTIQNATQRLQRRADDGIVRVSTLPFFTSAVLLPNLNRFEAENPKYELRIETSSAYADILNADADIAIRFGSAHSEDLFSEPLLSVKGQPVASPHYLSQAPPLKSAQDLKHHTLLNVRQSPDAWKFWGMAHGIPDLRGDGHLVFESILGALDAAKAGLGVALAMDPLIRTYAGYGDTIVPVSQPTGAAELRYNFVCERARLHEKKIQRTLRWLRSAVA
jgi:LysR family glycine cleavage system transcriptional activator